MAYERELTDEELEELFREALDQLADAILEIKAANANYANPKANPELATKRRSLARESLKYSLITYHDLRDQIEGRYQGGNPV